MDEPKTTMDSPFGTLVQTSDGSWTLYHPVHGQAFHSVEGARFEAWHLYVQSSGLRERLSGSLRERPNIRVLDVGMGLGYNACATIVAWLESRTVENLELESLEIDSALVKALAWGQAPWCSEWSDLWTLGPRNLQRIGPSQWQSRIAHPVSQSELTWNISVGDALKQNLGQNSFDYIWQDPFTPEMNPSLWSPSWFATLRNLSHQNTKLMTYSVSRIVRDALEAGGWRVERFKTPGKKRHWLRADPLS